MIQYMSNNTYRDENIKHHYIDDATLSAITHISVVTTLPLDTAKNVVVLLHGAIRKLVIRDGYAWPSRACPYHRPLDDAGVVLVQRIFHFLEDNRTGIKYQYDKMNMS